MRRVAIVEVRRTLTTDVRAIRDIVDARGSEGQLKLLDSKVLCVGAGGLGSPAALYLAAAGVGTLGIIDADTVDKSNLQRQILHTEDRVGEPKVDSAEKTLQALNSDITIRKHRTRLSSENVMEIFSEYDIILDGTDNFPTRYLINDACVGNKPNVHGSIYRFEGQATVFGPAVAAPATDACIQNRLRQSLRQAARSWSPRCTPGFGWRGGSDRSYQAILGKVQRSRVKC